MPEQPLWGASLVGTRRANVDGLECEGKVALAAKQYLQLLSGGHVATQCMRHRFAVVQAYYECGFDTISIYYPTVPS